MKKFLLIMTGMLMFNNLGFSQVEYTSTGSSGNYLLNYPANFGIVISAGLSITFKANHANTGAATLDINSIGAINVYTSVNANLVANDIKSGQIVTVVFDGFYFQMISASGNSLGGSGSSIIVDADGDTEINVEASPDQDVIHFNIGNNSGYPGGEYFTMIGPRFETVNNGGSVFIGKDAGLNDGLAVNSNNVFIGEESGKLNTSGGKNVGVGFRTISNSTTGNYNTAVGNQSLLSNGTGNSNSSIGALALKNNLDGNENVALGYYTMYEKTTGDYNVALGSKALRNNLTGSFGVAIGHESMANNVVTGVNFSTSVGYRSLMGAASSTANNNSAFGYEALKSITTGSFNSAFGRSALAANTSGGFNTALGNFALTKNTDGHKNIAIGHSSSFNNISGDENISLGYNSLNSNTNGIRNVAIGSEALTNTLGGNNIGIGYKAGFNNAGGNSNIAIGNNTLLATTSTGDNIAIGTGAGRTYDNGHRNLFIGFQADATVAGLTNATAIGHEAKVGQDNTIVLGGTGGFATKVGIGTSTPSVLLDIKSISNNASIELDCGSLKTSQIIFNEAGGYTGAIGYSNHNGEDYIFLYETGNALIAYNGQVSIGNNILPKSDLNVIGSVSNSLYIVNTSTVVYLDSTYHTIVGTMVGSTMNVTLPSAASCPGREYRISKKNGTGLLTIITDGTETIDGGASYGLAAGFNKGVTLISDGNTAWYIISKF